MSNGNGDKLKGIRKLIIGLVIFLVSAWLYRDGFIEMKPFMWLGAGIAGGGNVWDFVVGHLKLGNK